jgi:uncharacterized membrane protein YgdD (TMEM256/DUF423 family)
MIFVPMMRPGWRNLAVMILGFALVISPNVLWNLSHDLTTVSHTMDNAGWVRHGAKFDLGSLMAFFGSQFGVFGVISMAALIWAYLRPRTQAHLALVLLSIPAILVVSIQSLMDKAYANWAIATYFAGTVLVVMVLPRWGRIAAVALNGILAVALPVLLILAPWPMSGAKPLLNRYLGRHALSESILTLAEREDLPVVTSNRDILADLFYTGRDRDVALYAMPETGRPSSYYAQNFALPEEMLGSVLVISIGGITCPGEVFDGVVREGTWSNTDLRATRVKAACLLAN